jgi:hypothetical protein
MLTLTNITTNNVTTARHGFAPLLPDNNTKFLDGTGAWTVPPGSGGITIADTLVVFADGANNPKGDEDFSYNKTTNALTAGSFTSVSTAAGYVKLMEADAGGSNYLKILAPDALAGDVTWTLPSADAAGAFQSDGAGTVSIGLINKIASGAAPTVTAAGNIGVDTTADQLTYFGAAARVLPYIQTRCVGIEDLAAADDNKSIGMFPYGVTITSVGCSYVGTGSTPATISLEDGSGNAISITNTNPTCVAHGTNATYKTIVGTDADRILVSGEILRMDVTNAVDPETDDYTICYTYTVDAQ